MTSQPTTQDLPVSALLRWPGQARKVVEGPKFEQLVGSIRSQGVIEPLVVRPIFEDGSDSPRLFEVLAGERRRCAAKKAGLTEVPCVIRWDLGNDDAGAAALAHDENARREDLAPLEEAEAIARVVAEHGGDVNGAAERLGISPATVARRQALLSLSPDWRSALADPEDPRSSRGVGHLELVARLPADLQAEMFLELEHYWPGELTIEQLEKNIMHRLSRLSSAPWDVADDLLVPEAGACSACPRRSGASPLLFEELQGDDAKNDRCLDRVCWASKLAAFVDRKATEIRESTGQEPIRVTTSGSKAGGAVPKRNLVPCKKGVKGSRQALMVDGLNPGATYWVAPPVSGTAGDRAVSKAEKAAKLPTAKERLTRLYQLRIKAVSEALVLNLTVKKGGLPTPELPRLAALVVILGSDSPHLGRENQWQLASELADAAQEAHLRSWLRQGLQRSLLSAISYMPHRKVSELEAGLRLVADWFEVPWADLWASACKLKPTPKDLREAEAAAAGGPEKPKGSKRGKKAA